MRKISISISQALFSVIFLALFYTLLDGYLQNIVAGYRANTWLVLAGTIIALAITLFAARGRIVVEREPLELAGFLIVVVGTWLYFVVPSLPTLLPPTQSSDAVRVYQQVLFSYPDGKLVSWYPAGGALLAAMFSHWLGWAPLRVLHLTAASFVALSAGAVYGITGALLPRARLSKIAALLAPALLFAPWSYFAGIIDWEQYFFAQALAQLFILAAVWYTASYAENQNWTFVWLIGAALLSTVFAYPIFVALPLALFALVVLVQVLQKRNRRALIALGIFVALMVVTALVLQFAGILELQAGQISTTLEVGPSGVANPSLETLGGPIFLLLALIGIPVAWKRKTFGKVLLGFLVVWVLQYAALVVIQSFFPLSSYRVDKTFYILVFPLAILAALPLIRALEHLAARLVSTSRVAAAGFIGMMLLCGVGVIALRPPKFFSPFTEPELQTALWAQAHLDTYQISYLDPATIRAYWLVYGLWGETVPNEWFQWIPAGPKMGPATFSEWLRDPAWPQWAFLGDVDAQAIAPAQVIHRDGASGIVQKPAPNVDAPKPRHVEYWYFESSIKMLGYDLPRTTFAPGEPVTLTTYTESLAPPYFTLGWRVQLVGRDGEIVSQVSGDPFADKYPLQRWPPAAATRDVWTLPLKPDIAPGVYELRMGLYRRTDGHETSSWYADQATGAIISNKKPVWGAAPIAQIKVPLPQPSADELNAATPVNAHVGNNFALSRYTLSADPTTRRIHLTLYWQDLAKTKNDYTVFVHVLDAGGKVVAQKDAQPLDGAYPTSIWDAQEIVKEAYDLTIPGDARGPFSIEIGMYAQPSLQRLPVGNSDHIVLPNVMP